MLAPGLLRRILAHRLRYVVANIAISAITFARNLVFMRMLGLADLGQVALAQTLAMLVGFLQFGMINGGYRIYASGDRQENAKVNNVVFTFVGLITLLLLAAVALGLAPPARAGVDRNTLHLGLAVGVATLLSTWVNNSLIADGRLGQSNTINLVAAVASLLLAMAAQPGAIDLALWALLVQPALVMLLTVLTHAPVRPARPQLPLATVRRILSLGLIPFASGLLVLLALQLERWAISAVLGPESLGRFYVVMVYSIIFTLIPASLLNLYFPRAIKAHEKQDGAAFNTLVRRHALDLGAYIAVATALTAALLDLCLTRFLPRFAGTSHLVFLALPGFIAVALSDVASLYFNSIKRLRPLLLYGFALLGMYAVLLGIAHRTGHFTLETVALAKSAAALAAAGLLFIGFFRHRRNPTGDAAT